MAQISDLQNTTNSTSSDVYLVRQTGVDYNQSRETLAAGIGNARWVNTANYLAGTRVIASDGNQYVAAVNNGPTYANTIDPTITINEAIWILIPDKFEVSPINNDWNGYLDPAHTTPIEKADTSAGTRSFAVDTEIAPNLYVSANTGVTFSTTGISWLAGNTLYKLFTFTQEQLANIDVNEVPVFLKGENGSEYNTSNATTGITVTKPDTTTLKVEISFDIFATLGITKLWRFFVTERVGRVVELSPDASAKGIPITLASGIFTSGSSIPLSKSFFDMKEVEIKGDVNVTSGAKWTTRVFTKNFSVGNTIYYTVNNGTQLLAASITVTSATQLSVAFATAGGWVPRVEIVTGVI